MLFRFCPLLDALCIRALCTFLVNSLSITKPWMLSSLFDMVMNVCESKVIDSVGYCRLSCCYLLATKWVLVNDSIFSVLNYGRSFIHYFLIRNNLRDCQKLARLVLGIGCNHVRVPATSILENTSAGKCKSRPTEQDAHGRLVVITLPYWSLSYPTNYPTGDLDRETAYCLVITNNHEQVCEYGKSGIFFCSSSIVADAIALLETIDLCIRSMKVCVTGSMELQHQGYSILVHLNFD
ncbi:hypothetical protein LINPERHAP1_LOCUS24202 [Linum perenne]